MIWLDMILRTSVSDNDLLNSISLLVPSEKKNNVKLIESIEEIGTEGMTCLKSHLLGKEFNTSLTFYTAFEVTDSEIKIKQLSNLLNREILIADDTTLDPYSMILISPTGSCSKVKICASELDQNNEYVIKEKVNNHNDLS